MAREDKMPGLSQNDCLSGKGSEGNEPRSIWIYRDTETVDLCLGIEVKLLLP